jgi:hypothetical protein
MGRATLYYFTLDVAGSNSCGTVACAAEWPIFYATTVTMGAGLNAADFMTGKTAGEKLDFLQGLALVLLRRAYQWPERACKPLIKATRSITL